MRILNIFKMNFVPIIKLTFRICGGLFAVFTIILSFLSFEDMGINEIWIKVSVLASIPLASFVISTLLVVFVLRRNRIWKRGKNSVTACYGDLIKFAFKKKYKEKRIIAIPFNDTFDTIVEEPGEQTKNPLVSPQTLHGIWIEKYCSYYQIEPKELNDRIQASLEIHNLKGKPIKRSKGNCIRYSLGDVSIIDGPNNSIFFLVAISSYDSNNNAYISKKDLRNCIEQLLDFYDKNGQSIPMYIPLMGTGSSRAGLSHESSLKIIKSCVLTSEEKINGSVNIVVHNCDKNKISIFK